MAHYANHLSFLLLLVLFSSLHIEARESKFFTKTIHYDPNHTTSNVNEAEPPAPALAPAPAPAPALAPIESENGYGLYGQGSTEFPPTKTTTTATIANDENEVPTEELKSESYKEYNNAFSSSNYNNNGYTSKYNEKGYVTEPQGLSDTRFLENGKYFYDPKHPAAKTTTIANDENEIPTEKFSSEGYKAEYNYNKNYGNNGYTNSYNEKGVTQPQGLSDTRFLENGKYYYNPKNENYYQNGYGSVKGRNNNDEGYYRNSESSKYEFNTMEEYERQQGYPEIEDENTP